MKWHKEKNPAQYENFAKTVFNVEGGDEGINNLEAWFIKIGAPVKLANANIPRAAIADNAYGIASMLSIHELYPRIPLLKF